MKILILTIILNISPILYTFSQFDGSKDTLFLIHKGKKGILSSDTLIKKSRLRVHNILFESEILSNTRNQMECRGYGLYLDSVNDYCVSDKYELVNNKVKAFSQTENRVILAYQVVENCCQSMLYDMEVIGDSTLNLLYYSYGTHCGCNCVYDMRFEIGISFLDDEREQNFKKIKNISLNGELVFNIHNQEQTNMKAYDLFQSKLREIKERRK
jgi:endo-alpha-1,4-polygalactosaminidase (GH114 family)